jgi:hypothetical protein
MFYATISKLCKLLNISSCVICKLKFKHALHITSTLAASCRHTLIIVIICFHPKSKNAKLQEMI